MFDILSFNSLMVMKYSHFEFFTPTRIGFILHMICFNSGYDGKAILFRLVSVIQCWFSVAQQSPVFVFSQGCVKFFFCLFDQGRKIEQVDPDIREGFCGRHHALSADLSSAACDSLPAVCGSAWHPGGGAEAYSGYCIAHIPDIS